MHVQQGLTPILSPLPSEQGGDKVLRGGQSQKIHQSHERVRSPPLATHSHGWDREVQSRHISGRIGQVHFGNMGILQAFITKADSVDIERPVCMCCSDERSSLPRCHCCHRACKCSDVSRHVQSLMELTCLPHHNAGNIIEASPGSYTPGAL